MRDELAKFVIPVLDLLGGNVVRGIGGRRQEYRPIVSLLVDGHDPLRIAQVFERRFGFQTFYVADLDSLMGGGRQESTLQPLLDAGYRLILDAGIREPSDLEGLMGSPELEIVLALETVNSPDMLRALSALAGSSQLHFSLDLREGRPLTSDGHWPDDPFEIARTVMNCGVTSLILLDLAGVGTGQGPQTLELCRRLRDAYRGIQLITGGGIRSRGDVEETIAAGADRVLVATALHDGRLEL